MATETLTGTLGLLVNAALVVSAALTLLVSYRVIKGPTVPSPTAQARMPTGSHTTHR